MNTSTANSVRIAVPAVVLMGRDDGATLAGSADGKAALFEGRDDLRVIAGSGHFLQREVPDAVLAAVRGAL